VLASESWQGMASPFDTDMGEDLQLHLATETLPGRRGKTDYRTVCRLKLRPDKQQRVLDAIDAARRGVSAMPHVGETLAEDSFYARLLEGVKTVNAHLNLGTCNFNQTRLQGALDCEPALRALLASDRIEVRDMAAHYLQTLDELTVYARGGVTPAGSVSQLEPFRVVAGRLSAPAAGKAPAFRITEGPIRMDQRQIVNGKMIVKGSEKRPGQLFGGDRSTKLPKEGKQYTLTFDDGTTIRMRPFSTESYDEHAVRLGQNYYSLSGDIEVTMPGQGSPKQVEQLFEKLQQLGIPAEVAPAEYQEYLYLHQVAVVNRLPQDDAGYQRMMRQLEGRNAPIAERVEQMVGYWNGRLGVEDIRKLPRYRPGGVYQYDTLHRRTGEPIGYRRSERFDLDVAREMRGYNLMHQIVGEGSESYITMVDQALTHNGSLLSTTEKLRIGLKPGGMSPEADIASGGANYVFTRWRPDPRGAKSKREMGFYLKPGVAQRTDTIVYETDHYGRCYGDHVVRKHVASPAQWKRIAETSSNNETILKQNVTVLDNLDCIVLDSPVAKRRMLAVFQQHGVTTLPDGRKVDDIIHVISGAKKGYSGF